MKLVCYKSYHISPTVTYIFTTGQEYECDDDVSMSDLYIITDRIGFYFGDPEREPSSYLKKIIAPFISVYRYPKSDSIQSDKFCTLSKDQLIALGADFYKSGIPCFLYNVPLIDEYFDYKHIRRDNLIKDIIE